MVGVRSPTGGVVLVRGSDEVDVGETIVVYPVDDLLLVGYNSEDVDGGEGGVGERVCGWGGS